MLKENTVIIEMTGIFGAGYLPGLFKPVTTILRERYLRIEDNGKPSSLVTRYHIDNEAARINDPKRRERITELIRKANNLKPDEWIELIDSLRWADVLFQESVESYARSIDVVFRRGGRLQNYILLRGTRWEEAETNRFQPKLQFFLKAEYEAIKQTFERNKEVNRIIKCYPELYCESPKQAYELQEDWLQKVQRFPGLRYIERRKPDEEEFAREEFTEDIVNFIVPYINLFGFQTMLKTRIFISYSHKDTWFADKLEKTLTQRGFGVWIDKKEILAGDSLLNKIKEGIDTSKFLCAVISKNSINSNWVQEELERAMNQQIKSGKVKVLPLLLERALELPLFLEGKKYINFSKEAFDSGVEELMRRLKS